MKEVSNSTHRSIRYSILIRNSLTAWMSTSLLTGMSSTANKSSVELSKGEGPVRRKVQRIFPTMDYIDARCSNFSQFHLKDPCHF